MEVLPRRRGGAFESLRRRGGAEGDWGPSRASGAAIIHLAEDPENTGVAELLSRGKFEWLKC